MEPYKFCFLLNDVVVGYREREFPSDDAALAHARDLMSSLPSQDIEVWQAGRLVARTQALQEQATA